MTGTPVLHFEYAPTRSRELPATVAVLLHGRGADETDLASLQPALPEDWALVLPRAPFAAAPWGYGPGWAWYQYLGHNQPEPDSFTSSLHGITHLLRSLPDITGTRNANSLLGGFSQGGTVSLGYALAANAGKLDTLDAKIPRAHNVVNLSGFLPDHPLVPITAQSVSGTRFFWAHGTHDPNIPFALAKEGRSALITAGAAVTIFDARGGHWIDRGAVEELVKWVETG